MEPMTSFFLAAMAFVAVSHLATSATKVFRKNRKPTYQAFTRTRSDWHCFFSRSDLCGKDKDGHGGQHLSQNAHASQRRRSSHQARPRIYN